MEARDAAGARSLDGWLVTRGAPLPEPAPLDFVVTGTPRSGTKYVARLLREVGFHCTHERYFNPWEVIVRSGRLDSRRRGDSSWLAAPYLSALPETVKVFHVVRDPLAAVNSIIGTGQIDWPADYRTFIARHCWGDENYWPADVAGDAQHFWLRWNAMIEESGRVLRRFHLESLASSLTDLVRDIDPQRAESLDVQAVLGAMPPTVNARPHLGAARLTRAELTPELCAVARAYGYDY
jgi:hypothetical protein